MVNKAKLSLFLENNQNIKNNEAAYIYEDPVEIITANEPSEIAQAFAQIQCKLDENYHVAGWVSYEAGLWFESKLKSLLPEKPIVPYIYMGVYKERKILDGQSADQHWRQYEDKTAYALNGLQLSLDRESYEQAFDKIQDYLKAGDIYQVNFTQKATFDFEGSTKALYAALRNAQAVQYAAYIESDEIKVLSLSPELFITKSAGKLTAKPMKGTCRRGRTIDEDHKFSTALYHSEKERAENLMIVDLLRNDLSRQAAKGSVKVSNLYEVEKYRTFFTMTTTIEAKVEDGCSALDVMTSIFPCGSVTGAPKIRAQEIINEIEQEQRGIYTGAIGYFTPDGDMCFSVPIRTITINNDGKGELGIGGAIVADSVAVNEYDECLLKAEFLTKNYPRFDLIETMGYSPKDGIKFKDDHLERLEKSATYFSFSYDQKYINEQLERHIEYIKSNDVESFKIRVLLSKRGNISVTSEVVSLIDYDELPVVVLSKNNIDSQDTIYFHKTSLREFFVSEFIKYHAETGCFDVLFVNEKGELTEGSFTNLIIEKDGVYYTPPVACGLLPGIFRQQFLKDKSIKTQEVILRPEDLITADQVYLCNSVRGLIPVQIR